MQIENKVFWDVSETLLEIRRNERCGGIEFHMVGADPWKEREPNRRLVWRTWRSFDEEVRRCRRPLVGAYGSNCWERLGGKPVSKTLNVSMAILNLMRHSIGNQWSCFIRWKEDKPGGHLFSYVQSSLQCIVWFKTFLVRERSALATIIISRRVYLSGCQSGCLDVWMSVCPSFQNASSPAVLVRLSWYFNTMVPYLGKINDPHG